GIGFHTVTGLLGLPEQTSGAVANEVTADHPVAIAAWEEIRQWLQAAKVNRTLTRSRIGYLGHTYHGMLDMYSDFTQHTGQLGVHVEVLEMDDLAARVKSASDAQIDAKRDEVLEIFEVSEHSPSDPLAKKPGPDEMDWARR